MDHLGHVKCWIQHKFFNCVKFLETFYICFFFSNSLFILSLILYDFSIRLFRERRDRMKRGETTFIVQIAFRSRRNIRTNSITWRSRVTRSRRAARGEVLCTTEVNFFTYIPDNIPRYIEIQRQHAADEATKSTRRWDDEIYYEEKLKTRRSAWIDISTRAIFFLPINSQTTLAGLRI